MLSFQRQLLTPAGPAPPVLSPQYAAVFDSDDDEYETDDRSSVADSEPSFRRRSITPFMSTSNGNVQTSKAVSLLTMQLKRYREAEAAVIDSDWLSDGSESDNEDDETHHSHGEEATVSNSHCNEPTASKQVALIFNGSAEDPRQSLHEAAETPIDINQMPTFEDKQAKACFNGPHKSSFFAAIKNAIITGLKRCSNVTLLCRKQVQRTIHKEEDDEEIDPYVLFFGNGQDQGIAPKKKSTNCASTPATASTKTDATEDEVDPYTLFFGNNQDRGIPPIPAQSAQSKVATTTTTIPIPLTPEQQERASDEALLSFSLRTSWVNDLSQIPEAGPLKIKRGDVSYIERDFDWECCGCCAPNSRYEFLCACCQAHSKGKCCEEVVEEIDGMAGWGVGGLW